MRVKRNNIVAVRVFTGRDLIEKLYSEGWEVEQREYGLLSGVKKLSKGAINAISDLGDNLIVKAISRSKMGKKIIDKTQDSIEDSLDKRIKLDREIKELDKSIKDLSLSNEDSAKSIKNNLKNEAAKNKAYILEDKSNTSGKSFENGTIDIRNPEIKKAVRKKLKFDGRKDMEHFNNSNDLILFKESSGNPALAHEIGHVINRNSKGKAAKIDREAENIIEEFHKPADSPGGRDNSKGLWKSVERFFKGKKVVNNEKNASENAIKLLKESGASENELKLAKESLDKSLESYKEEHKMYYKFPFINKLQSFRKNKEK